MQTLQIYKKIDKPSAKVRIQRMVADLNDIRKEHLMCGFEKAAPIEIEIQVKTIEFQNTLTRMERELRFWVTDYREMIDELRELQRIIPKNDHESEESDRKARENVQKIITIETIRDECLSELKSIFLQYEDTASDSKRKVRRLEIELLESQRKVDELEYQVKRLQKKQ